jgi:hypothetical protein
MHRCLSSLKDPELIDAISGRPITGAVVDLPRTWTAYCLTAVDGCEKYRIHRPYEAVIKFPIKSPGKRPFSNDKK